MDIQQWVVMAHAFATVAMTGLIWFVQVVHYPLFAEVGEAGFARYESLHCRRINWIVAPSMLTEFATAAWLFFRPPTADVTWATTTGLALLALIWLSTAALQIPCHRRLERGLDPIVVRQLVATNWIRTIAWTLRAVLALHVVGAAFAAR